MTIYYSRSLSGFYDTNVNITEPGEDFIEVSYDKYVYLLSNQSVDKMIGVDEFGNVDLIDRPPPSGEALEVAQRNKLLNLNQLAATQKSALANRIGVLGDAIELDFATPDEVSELPRRSSQLTEWKKYAVLLGRVTAQPGWYEVVEWPSQPESGMDLGVDPTGSSS